MVWVHGGSFTSGSGNSYMYGPDFLVAEDVVVVTMNYRLGVLGFLNLNDTVAPGNMGLRDQVAALQWVKENIANFGGDPNKVTLFGESAGSASVNLIMLSPMAKGLFHRVICQSGSALANWAFRKSLRGNVEVLINSTGCNHYDPEKVVECLNKIPANEFPSMRLSTKEQENGLSRLPFVPSMDADFLPQEPLQILKHGNFNQVPFMAGINDGEGHLFAKAFPLRERSWGGDNFENFVPKDLNLPSGSAESKQVADGMKKLYFNGQEINKNNLQDFIDMTTDTEFLIPLRKSLNLQANYSKQPQYLYLMTFNGNISLKRAVGVPDLKGVCHAEELGYLWYIKLLPYQQYPQSSPEMETVNRMVTMWTNFAKTGEPTPEETELLPINWEPYTPSNPAYLIIDKELRMDRNIMKNRMDFWDDIYKKYTHSASA
ncbi:bile salt-activated lipase isoform X2 [Anabrus simplex]